MDEEVNEEKTPLDELDLSRYGPDSNWTLPIECTQPKPKPQKPRKGVEDYWVWLPTAVLGLDIHRPVTKLLAYLYLEANFTKSRTVKVSFQRAKRFFKIDCSRKTFYRAVNELERAGVITTKRQKGRSTEATIPEVYANKEWD